ncbi:MAG TPA: hypothetical protein VJU59_11620 [Paraburkholderia sp.]|uniref:hypothetical protein n=1 Tax=Paraburkholderia sp. TaxID=1926495 RepID=UPI002B48438E|nr:hypothetical protein [Paraburkholderia sp.]HKR40307.1 hypothetical protein [Paraburkholderia sp.]
MTKTQETDHLMRSPANAGHLARSIAQLRRAEREWAWLLETLGMDACQAALASIKGVQRRPDPQHIARKLGVTIPEHVSAEPLRGVMLARASSPPKARADAAYSNSLRALIRAHRGCLARTLVRAAIAVGVSVWLARMLISRAECQKVRAAISALDEALDAPPAPNPPLAKLLKRTPLWKKR